MSRGYERSIEIIDYIDGISEAVQCLANLDRLKPIRMSHSTFICVHREWARGVSYQRAFIQFARRSFGKPDYGTRWSMAFKRRQEPPLLTSDKASRPQDGRMLFRVAVAVGIGKFSNHFAAADVNAESRWNI